MFNKNVFTQKDPIADLVAPLLEAQTKAKMEELKGQQHKIDKNKNDKIDAHDFAILRGEKKAMKEEEEQVEEGWDDMLKAAKARRGPQPSGDSGKKAGSRYGGSKQKEKPEQDDKAKNEEVEHVDERTLTPGETSEKERIVKGMKKSLAGFKARYGDRAKSVMYATATARAKK